MHDNKNINKKASLTIEVSLLMPFIIYSLVIIIFLSYFLHDRCIIYNAVYTSLREPAGTESGGHNVMDHVNTHMDDSSIENACVSSFYSLCEKRLIGKWELSDKTDVYEDEITFSVQGKMNFFSGIITSFISDSLFCVNIEQSVKRCYEPDYLRRNK